MAYTSYLESDTDDAPYVLCPEPDLASLDGADCDDQWTEASVQNSISQGAQLRKHKASPYSLAGRHGVQIETIKLACPERSRPYRKCPRTKQYNDRTKLNSYSPKTDSPCACPSFPWDCTPQTSFYRPMSPKRSKAQRCPMRIAELAVPLKRQCLETWRSNCHVLPPFMVERLKQQVLDQKPVVQLSDALTCFKIKRKSSPAKRGCRSNFSSKRDSACTMDMAQLSAIFCHRMARKLDVPINISLSPELEKISKVIDNDISRITRKKIDGKNARNKRIQAEMASKVAVWIANILEDSTYKLLEENIRDLEEEEGPALDFLDALIDNVMAICEPITEPQGDIEDDFVGQEDDKGSNVLPETENVESDLSDTDQTQTTAYNTGKGRDIEGKENEESEPAPLEDYILSEIDNIIQQITSSSSSEDLFKDSSQGTINQNLEPVLDNKEQVDNEQVNNEQVNNEQVDNGEQEKVNELEGMINDENIADIADIDVTEPQRVTDEQSDESLDKKVTFSDTDMGSYTGDRRVTDNRYHSEHNDLPWSLSVENLKRNNLFAPPNEHLLSDVDESWPADVPITTIKATDSVNKSVTSLGNIMERDELQEDNIPPRPRPPPLASESYKHIADEKEIYEQGISLADKEQSQKDNADTIQEGLIETYEIIKCTCEIIECMCDGDQGKPDMTTESREKDTKLDGDEINQVTDEHALTKDSGTIEKSETDIDVDTSKTPKIQDIPKKIDYRVNSQTAPPWVRKDDGKGEPSEDSFPGYHRKQVQKIKEKDIRKWQKNLENMFSNIEIWNSWLETTCKNTIYLKKRTEIDKAFYPCAQEKDARSWLKLKKYIDKDAHLWRKLNHRTREKLKSYKCFYERDIKIVPANYSPMCNCMGWK